MKHVFALSGVGTLSVILFAGAVPAIAQDTLGSTALVQLQGGQEVTTYTQFRGGFRGRGFGRRGVYGRGFYGRRSYGGGSYGRPYDRRGIGGGALIGGLAAGALIGGAIASQAAPAPAYAAPVDDGVAYCQQRFRSYDTASGTYLGNDGQRHSCP